MRTVHVQVPRAPARINTVMGIDAGDKMSGFARICPRTYDVLELGDAANFDLLARLDALRENGDALALEMMQNQGKRVGRETFEACVWVGRYQQHAATLGVPCELITRQAAKSFILRAIGGNDPELKAALVKLYGGRAVAIGTKAAPGPLFGASTHALAALTVARTYIGTRMIEVRS